MAETIFEVASDGRVMEIGSRDLVLLGDAGAVEAYRLETGERATLLTLTDSRNRCDIWRSSNAAVPL